MADCSKSFRKPVAQISDRAKRYRANRCKRLGKFCEQCGSKQNLGIGHRDGNESNNRPDNLGTLCKSCNGKQAFLDKKAGRGVRTRQYNPKKKKRRKNPGAKSLGEYVSAAVSHSRGAHDAAGKLIHETPKARRRAFAREIWNRRGRRSNPESEADKLYRKFHGRGPDRINTMLVAGLDPYGDHPELASLGPLIRLIVGEDVELDDEGEVKDADWVSEITFVPSMREYRALTSRLDPKDAGETRQFRAWLKRVGAPDVAAVPNTRQIYFVGGNQNLDSHLKQLGSDPEKDICDLGFCYLIEYFAQKRFDRFEPTTYFHQFGEVTGVRPRLIYDRPHHLMQLAGGEYVVKSVGIDN